MLNAGLSVAVDAFMNGGDSVVADGSNAGGFVPPPPLDDELPMSDSILANMLSNLQSTERVRACMCTQFITVVWTTPPSPSNN
jgi:hypothetical protein